MTETQVPVRDAATVILLRDTAKGPAVLMGQRSASAVFMPEKYVFPGGALDAADKDVLLAGPLNPVCAERLAEDAPTDLGQALAVAAIRELWEETGQILGETSPWADPPAGWAPFAATGYRPTAAPLYFVFRAITPPGRPRRFDARFFLADAGALVTDPDDFSAAEAELSRLTWIPLSEAQDYPLPFITQVVLAEVAALKGPPEGPPDSVPFFRNDDEESLFRRLGLGR